MAMIPAKARLALKLGNLKYLDEVKDLIVPMADFAQGVKSKLGFVWRADLFPTGAKVPSIEFGPVINGRRALIVGEPQLTSGTHKETVLRIARELAADPQGNYLYIGMNRSWRTMVADGATGARLTNNTNRPDIIAVRWEPNTNSFRVDAWEVPSGDQTLQEMQDKLDADMLAIPQEYRGNIFSVPQDPA